MSDEYIQATDFDRIKSLIRDAFHDDPGIPLVPSILRVSSSMEDFWFLTSLFFPIWL